MEKCDEIGRWEKSDGKDQGQALTRRDAGGDVQTLSAIQGGTIGNVGVNAGG
jgi:hypothetical protein